MSRQLLVRYSCLFTDIDTFRYRYAAVANHPDGTGPLAAYFHGEMMNLPAASASIFDRNKFLAEDRILAFGT